MKDLIPCSVQVLTRNSEASIERCLESLQSFAEVIVLDGYSTDRTRAIAKRFQNVIVVDQDKSFLDGDGRITDFAAVRNAGLALAKELWFLYVDSDEIL